MYFCIRVGARAAQVSAVLSGGSSSEDCPTFNDFSKKMVTAVPAEHATLFQEDRWKLVMEGVTACGYEDGHFKQFVHDVKILSVAGFLSSVPTLLPRPKAALKEFIAVVALGGPAPAGPQPGGEARAPPTNDIGNMAVLGKLMGAACRQDAKALEELTAELDPTDQLRQLVQLHKQGEPLRQMEPDEHFAWPHRRGRPTGFWR